MNWENLGYALACVIAPIAWGLVVVWFSNRVDRRLLGRRVGKKKRHPRRIEYHI
jgi:hypothetical protein